MIARSASTRRALFLSACLCFAAWPVSADELDHIEPRFFSGPIATRERCNQLVQTNRRSGRRSGTAATPTAADVAECVALLQDTLAAGDPTSGATRPADSPSARIEKERHLLSSYRALQVLASILRGLPRSTTRDLDVIHTLLDADLRTQLNARGFGAAPLATAAHVDIQRADPGGYTGQTADAANQGLTALSFLLALETEHVAIGGGWDFSLDVETGWQPIFVMVKSAPGAEVTPAYVNGVLMFAGPRIAHASRSTEIAAVGQFGAARLSSTTPTFGSGGDERTVLIAANDIAEWGLAFGGGLDFRWYAHDVWLVHLTNQPLLPLLHVYGGLRHDQRFRRDADLERFNDPTGRVYFGFDVYPFRVTGGSASHGGRPMLTLGGGFAFETALVTTERLPSGYRVFASGVIDLNRVVER